MDNALVSTFSATNCEVPDRYDFSKLRVRRDYAEAIQSAFEDLTGHYRSSSRLQAWRAVKDFSKVLARHVGGKSVIRVPDNILLIYAESLRCRGVNDNTAASLYSFIRRMTGWLMEFAEGDRWSKVVLAENPFARSPPVRKNVHLSTEDLRHIASTCKQEIEEAIRRFDLGRSLAPNKDGAVNAASTAEAKVVARLIKLEQMGLWAQADLAKAHWQGTAGVKLRKLAPYRELTTASALPFALLILIITAANPSPIFYSPIECIEDHPTDPTRCILKWEKPRSAREQSESFLRSGRFAIPKLVDHIKRMTTPIRELAVADDRSRLFIVRNGRIARRLSIQSWHNALREFRQRHGLPSFSFTDVRRMCATATLMEHGSAAVTRKLQHMSPRTTSRYLQSDQALEHHYERLSRFQGLLTSTALSSTPNNLFHTASGLDCRDPYGGIAAGSAKGSVCMMYLQCAACPHAVVVYDSPSHVARLLKARAHLVEARDKAMTDVDASSRFSEIYQPILSIIERDLLPRVPRSVHDAAQRQMLTVDPLPPVD